jgi:hypothetical protein
MLDKATVKLELRNNQQKHTFSLVPWFQSSWRQRSLDVAASPSASLPIISGTTRETVDCEGFICMYRVMQSEAIVHYAPI